MVLDNKFIIYNLKKNKFNHLLIKILENKFIEIYVNNSFNSVLFLFH